MSAKPAQPAAQPAKASSSGMSNETAMELGGGALALLALGGGAWALSRRRRRTEEEEWYGDEVMVQHEEPAAAPEPMPHHMVEDVHSSKAAHQPMPRHDVIHREQPAIVAPAASAFAWGNAQRPAEAADDGSDRRPGETWVERAYRGPSPANPSASLKHRLRRAAFFDKRERDVAAGKAEPVDTDAGLPESATAELETA
jgi:hypothetical protein